jgi:transcription termination/antitermination protein NusG
MRGAEMPVGMEIHGQTEGGEALSLLQQYEDKQVSDSESQTQQRWYALWTHSHCEQLVRSQLNARGFELFLPTIGVWSRRAGVKHRIRQPLFPGYLFVHDQLCGPRYVELYKARGLVGVLGGKGGPDEIPEVEINAIRALVHSDLPVSPYPYLRTGQRVRILEGPLADVEGILVDRREAKGLLVLSVHLFRRSVAVEVDCSSAVPA